MTRIRDFLLPAFLVLSLCCTTSAAAGDLRVGAARVDITPAADPANPASGKYAHERLYVRAIVLDNGSVRAALIGADQAMLPNSVWEPASKQIAAELNCPVENIVMSVTHTHSGWGPGANPFARRPQPDRPGAASSPATADVPPPPFVGQMVDAVR